MDVNMNEARLVGIERVAAAAEIAEPLRVAQNNLLSELPGAVFAILTLAWIVGSFVALF
jgi:hypothetical protein